MDRPAEAVRALLWWPEKRRIEGDGKGKKRAGWKLDGEVGEGQVQGKGRGKGKDKEIEGWGERG
eukprot:CAMPEP_0117666070 /NCGR_PEP_ID=MMETSP0804-20121206/10164_1 /TAXON_ID=1074897 /ORGANISM="Tetraselmis astigmatica, Strain CCMP880" /LENGTH=63 /DNA_ID=CAMNT_0005473559 /DNA_START=46 /DNA_END=233 /DNA_ORIENTATION=+